MDRRHFLKSTTAATAVALTVQAPQNPLAVAAPEQRAIVQDLAFGRPVRVSSTAYAPTPGQCAVDGTRLSWWTSAPRDPAWIEVDLQAQCTINRIRIVFPHEAGDVPPQSTRWTPAHDVLGSYAVAYAIELSTDGKKWTTIFHTNNGVGGELHLPIEPQKARYVRMVCNKRSYSQYGVAVSSLEVFGQCTQMRPAPGGWTAPRPARKSASPVLPPRPDGHLVGGWDMEMIGPGGTHADGASISTPRFNSRNWHQATVPGTVLTTLVDQGVFPDPLFGLNNLQIPEALNKYSWWYRKSFILPESYHTRRVWLHFDGINYTAEVWLNGKRIGGIEGAFIRGVFDITDALRVNGTNVLAVRVNPVPHPGLPDEQSWKTGTGFNGGQPARDGPNFFCTVGWDWIPGIRDRCTGIWNHVFLSTTGPVAIRNPHVKTVLPLPDTSSARVTVAADVLNAGSQSVEGVLKGVIGDITFQKNITLNAGETRTVTFDAKDFPQLVMKQPRLWWPNGYGEQYLHELTLSFEINGQKSDSATTQFGVRQFEYEKLPELVIKCNGHKIMCRGGDWGLDEAMKRIPYKSMEAWIRMHHLAHITIIRNWTGESNSEEFFALCDKYGILVWTEFWMANPGDGPDPDNPSLLLANAEDTFKRYRNHACIAIWCGRNEGPPPAMINAALNKMAHELDGTRYYQPGSSFAGVQSGGPYFFQEPAAYFEPRYNGFKTEIGSTSVPTLDSLLTTMPEDQLWPNHNNTWAYHDYCANHPHYHSAQDTTTYEAAMFRRFGATANIQQFVQRAQMLNYEVYRGIFEGYMSKLWHNASGVILWMSHPAQNSTVWQLYAHDFEAHASLYGAKKGCEPRHVQLSALDGSVDVINNTIQSLHDITVAALVYNLDGTVAGRTQQTMNASANAKTHGFVLKLPEQLSETYFVRLTMHSASGTLLSDNFYWQSQRDGDLRGMNNMPKVRPAGKVLLEKQSPMWKASVTLHNPASTPAIAIKLTPRKESMIGPSSRILPVFIEDNYFSLMPGESKSVTIEFHKDDTDGRNPIIEISGWNIDTSTLAC